MAPRFLVLTADLNKDSIIAGFIIGERDEHDDTTARVVTIDVDPVYQRKKVGTQLLIELEKKIRDEQEINRFTLQVHHQNEQAIEFYLKNGYKIKKSLRNYYGRKEHAFLMEKILPQQGESDRRNI
jgi:ribosomal protein S18 acetylase RimI-like enzyme